MIVLRGACIQLEARQKQSDVRHTVIPEASACGLVGLRNREPRKRALADLSALGNISDLGGLGGSWDIT
jgi:hypothetical protein